MNRHFAAQLTREMKELADDTVAAAFDKYGDRWAIMGENTFGWLADEEEPVLIMYRFPGQLIDWEINDKWFAAAV